MKTHSLSYLRSVLVLCSLAVVSLPAASALADAKVYQDTVRSTTWVLAKSDGKTSSGTGVLVDATQKLVVTNYRVVGDARTAIIFFPQMQNDKPVVDRKNYLDNVQKLGTRGRVVAVDRNRDLALIQCEKLPEGVTAIKLARSSVGPGEQVNSVGNPGTTGALWVYTSGTVRAVYKKQFRAGSSEQDFTVVETQAPINTGDSGGPVVNNQGELVAVSQAIGPNAQAVSHCVDISEIHALLASPWKPAPLPVADVLTRAELTHTQHASGHFEVQIDSDGKQKQAVFVSQDVEYFEKADVRKVWSLAAVVKEAPKPEVTMKLLDQSGRTKIGSWTIEQNEKREYLIIYCAKVDATAAPDAVRSTIEYVAKLTALMKKELTPAEEKVTPASDLLDEWLN